jgi:mono/diheme cytochrome c family protein
MKTKWLVLAAAAACFALAGATARAADDDKISFGKHIRPLLEQHCSQCHEPDNKHAGFDVTNYREFKRGGDSGRAIEPGEPENSLLMDKILGKSQPRMPYKLPPLSDKEIGLFRKWIEQGAHGD